MDDITDAYMSDVGGHELLKKEETNELIKKAQAGDIAARNRIIEHNMRWVIKLSKKYSNRGLDQCDLISEGVLALAHAIRKCDPNKAQFSTYCTYWIESYMDRASMDKGRSVRIPIHRTKDFRKILKLQKKFEEQNGQLPSHEYLSEKMETPIGNVKRLLDDHQSILSLNYQHKEYEENTLIDSLKSETPGCEELVSQHSVNSLIGGYLSELPERQKEVLSLRFGLNGYEVHTFENAGKALNLSRERVRQIQVVALEKIKVLIISEHSQEFFLEESATV
jgi:RNA polymerase nonessential primary-like sigma factor